MSPSSWLKAQLWRRGVELVRRSALDRNIDQSGERLQVSPLSYEEPRLLVFGDPTREPWVTIGDYSSVHHTVEIFVDGGHPLDWVSTYIFRAMRDTDSPPRPVDESMSGGPVRIGHDVWVGWRSTIMSGLTIGHGSVVAAQTVVTHDVEPYSIVAGNPARHLRYRFDEPTREALSRIAWWAWPDQKVVAHADQLSNPDVAGFVERHDPERPHRARCPDC